MPAGRDPLLDSLVDLRWSGSGLGPFSRGEAAPPFSRLAVPAARLRELARVLPTGAPDPVPVLVVAEGEWDEALGEAAEAMNAFVEMAEERAEIEAFSVRLPDAVRTERWVRDLKGFQEIEVFAEIPLGPGLDDALAALAEAEFPGAALSASGASVAQLAAFVHGCVSLDQPFQLLDPPARWSSRGGEVGVANVALATALAVSDDLSEKEIGRILGAEGVVLTRDGIAFEGRTLGAIPLEEARNFLVSVMVADASGLAV